MSVYTVKFEAVSVSTAITILQLTAASDAVVRVTGAWCNQSGSTTSASQRIQLLRKTVTAATSTGALTPTPTAPGEVAFGGSVGHVYTGGEGTDGVVLIADGFNWLAGWRWTASDVGEAIVVPPSGLIALKFPVAPGAAQNVTAGFVFEEIG